MKEPDPNPLEALLSVITENRGDVVDELIQTGIDPATRLKEDGTTLLHFAAWMGCAESLAVLCRYVREVDLEDRAGRTPLLAALATLTKVSGTTACVRILLAAGAEPACRDQYAKNAVLYAAQQNNVEALELLAAAGANLFSVDNEGQSALHLAVAADRVEAAQYLIGKGLSVNMENRAGRPLLPIAAWHSETLFRVVLEAGALLDARIDAKLHTTLHWTAQKGLIESTKLLLAAGASVNVRTKFGDTPLHGACRHANLKIVSMLIRAGADVNAADGGGDRPLHWLMQNPGNAPGIIAAVGGLLLEAGADAEVKNNKGHKPIDGCFNAESRAAFETVLLTRFASHGCDCMEGDAPPGRKLSL